LKTISIRKPKKKRIKKILTKAMTTHEFLAKKKRKLRIMLRNYCNVPILNTFEFRLDSDE
jgi:hypothetical protein